MVYITTLFSAKDFRPLLPKFHQIKKNLQNPMRQFVVDDLSPMEQDNIDSYLKRNLKAGPMIGVYWILLPDDILTDIQKEHTDCGPFYFGVEVERNAVRFEFLVRSNTNLHCDCIAHATPAQRQYVLDFIDTMLDEECIKS